MHLPNSFNREPSMVLYGAQALCTMKSGISCILSHCAVTSLTLAPHDASIHPAICLAVNWLILNHHACAPGWIPFISLYIISSISILDCSTASAVLYPHGQQAMLYICPCAHHPQLLAPSQRLHVPQSLYFIILHLLDCPEFTGSLR
jgi:hypothetical protein